MRTDSDTRSTSGPFSYRRRVLCAMVVATALATLTASQSGAASAAPTVAVSSAASSTGDEGTGGPAQRRHVTKAALRGELRQLVRMPGGPAGAIVVVNRPSGRTVYSAGVRNLRSGKPVRASHHMRLASTAKAFSGAVALSLVDQKRLSLNQTIGSRLPWLPAPWRKVTLRQALNHTSGLPDFFSSDRYLAYLTDNLHARPTPRFLLRLLADESLEFKPGSQYAYSNTDNFIVALMAQSVTGQSYDRLLNRRVYRPLGLRNTRLPKGWKMPAPYLHGYQPDPPGPREDVTEVVSGAFAWASGGLVSTPTDLNRFIRGYAGARLFSRAVQRRQLTFIPGKSEPTGPGVNSAGLGIFRYRTPCGTVYGHTGNTAGYTQFMASTLDGRRSVTVSINGQITNKSTGAAGRAFTRLRKIETDAVCQALAPKRDVRLTRSIRRALATTAAPGAIVGVWQAGRAPYVRTFGVRNTTTKRPMRRDLTTRIGSVTKTFTVTALLQLADRGKVSLDDPISRYIRGVRGGNRITLRHLATMQSGLVNYSVVPAVDRSLMFHPYRTWTPRQVLAPAIKRKLLFAPGTRVSYSNTNTILLGLVVQKVSGQRLETYIRRRITGPLKMRSTAFPRGSALPSPYASGYGNETPDGSTVDATNFNPSWTWSAGEMISTLDDQRIWARRLATGRGLLSPATQRQRRASVRGPGDPFTYGIGMFNVHGWIGHNGSLPGYQTLTLYLPQTKTTVVAFVNTNIERNGEAPSTVLGRAITRVVSPNHVYTLPAAPTTSED